MLTSRDFLALATTIRETPDGYEHCDFLLLNDKGGKSRTFASRLDLGEL